MIGLVIVTFFTAMATGFALFYRLIYVMGLTALLAFVWNWFTMLGLDVAIERRTRRVRVGEDIEERILVRNNSRLPKPTLEVEDITDMPGYSNGMALSLSNNSFRSWLARAPARKRGAYTLGPVRVSNTDLFGLFRRERDFGGQDSLLVYPRIYDLPEFEMPSAYISGDSSAQRRSHNLTPHAASVREYAFGDSLSRIHWASTARTGRLMSKEFDLGLASDVWLIVDLHRDVQAGELEESTDEYAVSIAASLARKYERAQMPVGLVSYGDARYVLPADTGSGQYERIMEYLAMSKAEGSLPLEDVLVREEQLWGTQSALVIITPSHREAWAVAVKELARRRIRIATILVDGQSFGGMFETMSIVPSLYEAAVDPYVVRMGDDVPLALSHTYTVTASEPDAVEATA